MCCSVHPGWRTAVGYNVHRYYGLQPELDTYKSIIKACLVAKELDMALTTLFDIQRSGRRADQETWDMLIEICAVVGKWDAGLEIIREMLAEEVRHHRCAAYKRFVGAVSVLFVLYRFFIDVFFIFLLV